MKRRWTWPLAWSARLARMTCTALAFLGFGLGAAGLSWAVLPVVGWRAPSAAAAQTRSRRWVSRAFRLFHAYMCWTRLVRYDSRPLASATLPQPCVLVANHPTLVDVTAVLAARDDAVCVVKGALFTSPLVGPLLRRCGHIRGDVAPGELLRQARAVLGDGGTVLIFPEGTRSPVGRVGRLKRGALELACRAQVPVQPLLLTCDPPLLAKEHPWNRVPRAVPHLRVAVLPVLVPGDSSSRALCDQLQSLYEGALTRLAPLQRTADEAHSAAAHGSGRNSSPDATGAVT